MRKFVFLFLSLLSALSFFSALSHKAALAGASAKDLRSYEVLTTIAPHKDFVKKIAGETVSVSLLLPPNANLHTFEPTAKQVLSASRTDIWFLLGETFEERALPALQSYNSDLRVVNFSEQLPLICDRASDSCPHSACDLHYWLSPRLAKEQAKIIARSLIKQYPEHAEKFDRGLKRLIEELDLLDEEMEHVLSPLKDRTLFVSHPAYSYLCRDYGLQQHSIEFEGKDPTARQLTSILQKAREQKVKTIFIQKQFHNKGAKLIAEELGAKLVEIDPYQENYVEMMRKIASKFAAK